LTSRKRLTVLWTGWDPPVSLTLVEEPPEDTFPYRIQRAVGSDCKRRTESALSRDSDL